LAGLARLWWPRKRGEDEDDHEIPRLLPIVIVLVVALDFLAAPGHEHDQEDEHGWENGDALPATCKGERDNVVESAILPANESVY
jgi:hypothetical protein